MDAEQEAAIAEARDLQQRIDGLVRKIEFEQVRQAQLEEERAFCNEQLVVLDKAAQRMSVQAVKDFKQLNDHVSRGALDARDLLQLLRDVSEKYFSYKNLSTATKNLTQYNDEYANKFKFYRELRRISLGCVMAVDTNLVSQEAVRTKVEKSYLANTDYWLAYAIAAVMLWWSDERAAAGRAVKRALSFSARKSSLFFLFVNLKFGRRDSALKWYEYYLGDAHANDVGEEFQYLLEAQLSGSFGNDRELEESVRAHIDDMFNEITVYSINFHEDVSEAACRFMQTKSHVSDFEFFNLPEYCEQWEQMKTVLSDAEKNVMVAREYQRLAQEPERSEGVNERLEDTIYNLIESMDPQEEQLYRKIRYNELVIAAKGDVHKAEVAFAERYPENGPVGFADLLKKWAFTEDDAIILPQTRRFATERLGSDIRAGMNKFIEGYRSSVQDRYTLKVDGWSKACNEDELGIAKNDFNEFYKKHSIWQYLKDKFIIIWMVMIVVGLAGLVLSAVLWRTPAPIVVSILLVLIGAFCLWRQIDNLKQVIERRRRKDLEIIERTLDEMREWRTAFQEADKGSDALMQALDLFKA